MKDFWIAEWGGLGIIRFRSFCWGRRFTFFSFDVSGYLSGCFWDEVFRCQNATNYYVFVKDYVFYFGAET